MGKVEEHEHIFDIFTKLYDFREKNVQVISAQDSLHFYNTHQSEDNGTEKSNITSKEVDIYFLLQFFVEKHPDGHFIIDEFPFYWKGKIHIFSF